MLEVKNLTKFYDSLAAVDDLTFTLAPGEVLGLVGPNGAGKTTTLRTIAGILKPTSGAITVGGHDLAGDPVSAKRLLAFMPDEPHLFEHLTVEEHLQLTARLYELGDVTSRAQALLVELELAEKSRSLPGELSRGMKQKLAIACGLLHEPKALLFDEPLTGLDPSGIRKMKQTIVARARAGGGVILSSHLLHLVEEICTRVLVMQRGKMVACGTLAEIMNARPDLAGKSLEEVFLALTGSSS